MQGFRGTRARLGSVDEFNIAVASAGWETDFRQLDQGVAAVDMESCASKSISILRVGFSSRIHQLACPPKGHITFGIPAAPQAGFNFRGQEANSESLTRFDTVADTDFVTQSGFSAYTLSCQVGRLSELSELLGRTDIASSAIPSGELRAVHPQQLIWLRSRLEQLFVQCQQNEISDAARDSLLADMETEIPLLILQAWAEGEVSSVDSPSKRLRVLQRALDYIHSNARSIFTIEDVCRNSGCSLSTLERAFGERFAVSPKRYVTMLRLSGVHRALLSPNESRNVGDVASDWGFWHLSKFSADYRRMFGELPSATRGMISTT